MRILILSSAFSGLTQRVQRELVLLGHNIQEHYDLEEHSLRAQLANFSPDVVICPFLTQRIPADVYQQYLCLVVHPGIEGDRGPSSLDWAISGGAAEWGVTLLQADEEMDAGDIWGTKVFPLREAGKTSIYKREVSTAAIALIKEALVNIASGTFKPRPLNYSNPEVKGELLPLMRQPDRKIDWQKDSTDSIVRKLNAADTNPGVRDQLGGADVNLFGVARESTLRGEPGEFLAVYKGAVCRATVDGAVWIKQIKCISHPTIPQLKLPATVALPLLLGNEVLSNLGAPQDPHAIEDVWVDRRGDTAYIYFNFYNGAASTQQCVELRNAIREAKSSDAKCLVFMGGEDFFNNGIHLNCIEASKDPALESWLNINAIDDVVKEIIDTPNQVTVAALRNNAGAGGAVMALACDEVIIREGVVLNPHYKNMGLYGSEYWTYLMPRRLGHALTSRIVEECQPMLAHEAMDVGFADVMFEEDWQSFHVQLMNYCEQLPSRLDMTEFLRVKAQQRANDEQEKPLEQYRREELIEMKEIFDDPGAFYHQARREFVFKIKPVKEVAAEAQSQMVG